MITETYHYRVVARAIALIEASPRVPSLEALAGELGMSPAHFQRLFSRWAGVSPGRYWQYLALADARRLLAMRESVLDTSLAVGLSGAGRLHGLFLRWEAMSPGSFARGGAGLTIRHGEAETPYGPALGMVTDVGLCGLAFTAETGPAAALGDLMSRWPGAEFRRDDPAVAPLILAATGPRESDLTLHLMGGPFQIKVWEALLHIPEGQVTTYGHLARAVGHDRAARAVGTAVGRNPLAGIIPCHRVLRKGCGLGGYHWGLPVKRAMLAREAARTAACRPDTAPA